MDALTAAYRARVRRLAGRTVATVVDWWDGLDVDDTDAVAVFARRSARTVAAAQIEAVAGADGYVAGYVAARGVPARPVGLNPARWAGRTIDGAPVGRVAVGAVISTRAARADSHPAPRTVGTAVLTRRLGDTVVDTARAAERAAMDAQPAVAGFDVVAAPDACPFCADLAAGEQRLLDADVEFHPHCRCTTRPVVTRDARR
ncbi:MAG: hypothetical protein IPM45_17980 [Acidimicrobiales bacterium]|nr:hypothetical protein [Acidimicrobiales bacterium]